MSLFVIACGQEELCTTSLLGKPLFAQVLASIGKTDESVFIVHKEGSEIAEAVHAFDENIHCLSVESDILTDQIEEAISLAESIHILKDKQITFVPLDYIYTVPVLPYIPDGNAIVCHPGQGSFYVSLSEDGKIKIDEEGLVASIIRFQDVGDLKAICVDMEFGSWKELLKHMTEQSSFVGIPKVAEEIIQVATSEERTQYESYVHRFVFALDGVVANFTTYWYSVWSRVLSNFHITLTNNIYQSIIADNTDEEIAQTLNISVELMQMKKNAIVEEQIKYGFYTLTQGFSEIVDFLQRRGHIVQIYSHWSEMNTIGILDTLNIPANLVIYSVSDTSINMNKTIMFESTRQGIQAAKKAGAKWIIGCPSYYSNDAMVQMGANVVLQNFENPEIIVETLLNTKQIQQVEAEFSIDDAINKLFPQSIVSSENIVVSGNLSNIYPTTIQTENGELKTVAKLNALPSERTRVVQLLSVYEREQVFYERVSKYVPVRIPEYYGALKDDNWENKGLLLEDVRMNCSVNRLLDAESIDVSIKVVSELARLHSTFWNKVPESFPLQPMILPVAELNDMWQRFETKWESVLGAKGIDKLFECKTEIENNARRLQEKSQTLLHGDVKSANLFFESDSTPGFLDWQFASVGKGVQDLVFMMIESFSMEKMDVCYSLLKDYYFTKLQEYGVTNYSKEEYEADFKAAVAYYPFFVAIWYGSMESEKLLDKNFPFFYLRRYVRFLERL
jgi:beta-phosphoglucomutase-like phosphatase (HAD superfamily)/thiamine kinase-like enzyme